MADVFTEQAEDPFISQAEDYERRHRKGACRTLRHPSYPLITDRVDFRGKKILDVGCGSGYFKDHLDNEKVCYQSYTGIDGSPGIALGGLKGHDNKIDLRCITWPYPSRLEEKRLLDMEFDIAVIFGLTYIFGGLDSGLPFRFIEFTSNFVRESIVFDWRKPKEEEVGLEKIFILSDFSLSLIDATERRIWCLMKKK